MQNVWKILLVLVLVFFLYQSWGVIQEHGLGGFFELMDANSATQLAMLDLTICLILIAVWMVLDARRRGGGAAVALAVVGIVLSLVLGVAGPLVYLILRPAASA